MSALSCAPQAADQRSRKLDIHGEFIPYSLYADEESGWRQRIEDKLTSTVAARDGFIRAFLEGKAIASKQIRDALTPKAVLARLDGLRTVLAGEEKSGLAHSLAEAGLLPMYGLPTRTRSLYQGFTFKDSGSAEWKEISRDLDLSVYEFAPGQTLIKDKQEHLCIGFTGSLPEFRYTRNQDVTTVNPQSDPFEAEFILNKCTSCGAWSRHVTLSAADACVGCGATLDPIESHLCKTPAAYRTDFRPSLFESDYVSRCRNRSVAAEATPLTLVPSVESNLCLAFSSQARTFRVNQGNQVSTVAGGSIGEGFTGHLGTTPYPSLSSRKLMFANQFVVSDQQPKGFEVNEGTVAETFWLASGKITDTLFIAPNAINPSLALIGDTGSLRTVGVRAAAISASFLIAARCALELDADPEEFEIMDPRVHQYPDGTRVPLLQITDRLINGSGYCKRLAEKVDTQPRLLTFIRSILADRNAYPLNQLLIGTHASRCDKSCYLCIQRYGNQPYHGLLDWRLGLAFLQVMEQSSWMCGLDGNFSHPSLSDWPRLAHLYAEELASTDPATDIRQQGDLTYLRLTATGDWHVIVHPLWSTRKDKGILIDLARTLDGNVLRSVSTFELSRRLLATRHQMLLKELPEVRHE